MVKKKDRTINDNIYEAQRNKDFDNMKKCLEFYAKIDNYIELHDYKGLHKCEMIGNSPLSDQGDNARKVLSRLTTV